MFKVLCGSFLMVFVNLGFLLLARFGLAVWNFCLSFWLYLLVGDLNYYLVSVFGVCVFVGFLFDF